MIVFVFVENVRKNQINTLLYSRFEAIRQMKVYLNPRSAKTLQYVFCFFLGGEKCRHVLIDCHLNLRTHRHTDNQNNTTGCQTFHTLPFPDPDSSASCNSVKSSKRSMIYVTQELIQFISIDQIFSTVIC